VGWLWYLGMLVPAIGIIQISYYAHADRYTYLPGIGLVLAGTWAVGEWSAGWQHRRAVLGGLMAAVIGALMVCAWTQTAYWKNSEILWSHTLACTADNEVVRDGLGAAVLQKGRTDEAISQFQYALQINPNYERAHFRLASALLQKGRVDEAIAQFLDALEIDPDRGEVHNSLGCALLRQGRVAEAAGHFQKALQLNPDYPQAHYNLGNILLEKGSVDDAIAQYQYALQIKPDYAQAQVNLGGALLQKGRVDEAIFQYQHALQNDPDCAQARVSLGAVLLQRGKVEEAITQFQQALQLEPNDPEVQNRLAWLLATGPKASLRNGNKAVELARQANALTGGENPIILNTLAAAFAEAGRFPEAVETAQRALRLAEAQSDTTLAGTLQFELKLYQAGSPFHSPEQTH
jgi:tetratricopeptide (TPR) repeat protein